ncbi:MAG: hypothetical protein JW900_02805 [Anaerolineae bacterium]|nr:hypothetical protein [Anaerolineae bacterium]
MMRKNDQDSSTMAQARKFFPNAGTAYGLVLGIGFALIVWGRDAMLLAASHAHLAWVKLLLGIPIAVVICCLSCRLAATSYSAAVYVAMGIGSGVILGVLVGHMPFEGNTLVTWLLDRRVQGLVVFPFGPAAAAKTAFIIIAGALTGAGTGFLEYLLLERAWDHATAKGKMSFGSWAYLFFGILPVLVLMSWPVEEMINKPIRDPQQSTGEIIGLIVAGDLAKAQADRFAYSSLAPYIDQFSDEYTVYLVGYQVDYLYQFYTDVVFDNGFVMRCVVGGTQVSYCSSFSEQVSNWMDDLAYFGSHGVQRWMERPIQQLVVDESVLRWWTEHRDQLSGAYELGHSGQQGGWVFMSARFDSGFEMICRFHGTSPTHLDRCVQVAP